MKTKNVELTSPKNIGGGWAIFIPGKPNIIKSTREVAIEYIFNELMKMAREKRIEAWKWKREREK